MSKSRVVWDTLSREKVRGLLMLLFAAWRLRSIEMKFMYVAVVLVASGRAGRDVPLKEFLADQCRTAGSTEDEEQVESRRKICWRSAYILGIGASVMFTNVSWIELCKLSTIAMGIAFALFIGGIAFYEWKNPPKSGLRNLLRLLYATISSRNLSNNSSTIFSDNDHLFNIPMLRWLNKVVESSSIPPSVEELPIMEERFSTFEQRVQDVKSLLTMVPLWTTFLVYGLLQATGNTFFYEQANYMNNRLGQISHVPIVIFVIIKSTTSFIVSRICDVLFPSFWGQKISRHVMLRIDVGLAILPICCIVAWRVEDYRLHKYVGLEISISMFWLIPQFFLLGLMEGLVQDGMEEIYFRVVPESLRKYGPPFTLFAMNIGNFTSLAFILNFKGLFSDDLDTSRLGAYYKIIAYVCFVNVLFYCFVAMYYCLEEESSAQETEQPLEELNQSSEEDIVESSQSTTS